MTHLEDFTTSTTIRAKDSYENFGASCRNEVKLHRADNGRFSDKDFMHSIRDNKQSLELCAVGAHHQNGVSERAIRTIVESARIMLLHARRLWPEAMPQLLWPFALSYATYFHYHLHLDADKKTPIEKFCSTPSTFDLSNIHSFGCPVHVLDHRLQTGNKIPRWEPRCRLGIFVGHSPLHAKNVALILNPYAGLVSPQFHLIFDDHFTTVSSLRKGTTPANWAELYHTKAVYLAHQDTNNLLLFSFDDPITSENEGDVPDLIAEDDASVDSMLPNEGGVSIHKAFMNLERNPSQPARK